MRIDNETLRLFAYSMATCLSGGLAPKRSLELSAEGVRSKAFRGVVRVALKRCDQGMPLSEALEPGAQVFPRYLLPVVRAGEVGGRQVEAFQLLHDHCHRLGPSLRLVRNTWLYPLVCVVFGWVIRIGILVYFGRHAAVWPFIGSTFGYGLVLALLGWLVFKIEPVRKVIDLALLQIPVIREVEIHQAVLLFFATFRLVYEAGGVGVVTMFDLAAKTVRNSALREDLLKARRILDQQGSFADAFGQLAFLEDRIKGLVATGSVSGRLEQSLAVIVDAATQQLEFTLKAFNSVFQRVVALTVGMSIVETVLILNL